MLIDYSKISSPCFVLDEEKLIKNLQLIDSIQKAVEVKIILAFKGFALWKCFPMMRRYIDSAAASSLHEVRLCSEEMHAKSHTYAVAYFDKEFDEIINLSSHVTFNSFAQFEKFGQQAIGKVSCGLRVNPEWSNVKTELYNPSSQHSRLGVLSDHMPESLPDGLEGLHFHMLCESDSYSLAHVLEHFQVRFGKYLHQLKWVNMGGGHLITREDYDIKHLISMLKKFKKKYNLEIILEPGCAFVWQAGDLVASILDIVENGRIKTAILDVSFTCHMPDTLEMPYRPEVLNASLEETESGHPYRLGGVSCLAGDFLDTYYFKKPLKIGDQIILHDMMHYTMVRSSLFNGVNHPSIGIWRDGQFELIREFGYQDFKSRLS